MTDTEAKLLADLAAYEAAATPGPWFWDDDNYMLLTDRYGKDETTWPADVSHAILLCDEPEGMYEGGRPRPNDRDFIAMCRTAVPVLLRVLMEQQQRIVDLLQWKQGNLTHRLDQQQAKVEELRSAVTLEVERMLRAEVAARQCLSLIGERPSPVLAEIRGILTEALKR